MIGVPRPSKDRQRPAEASPDEVEANSEDSFPASDAPSWTPVTGTARSGRPPERDLDRFSGKDRDMPKNSSGSQPWLHQRGKEIQAFGTARQFPLGLSRDARLYSCERLNQILADTQILYALYKKHHWLMRGPTFYQLHLLLDKHAGEQLALIDTIAERVQTLGGVAIGDPRHVAEITRVPRPPNGCEEVPAMLSRLLEAHEMILIDAHEAAGRAAKLGDDGTNDLIVSDVIRTGEMQAWFLAEHLVDTPLVHA
jgi:starvation-inducible DNA-binding protein